MFVQNHVIKPTNNELSTPPNENISASLVQASLLSEHFKVSDSELYTLKSELRSRKIARFLVTVGFPVFAVMYTKNTKMIVFPGIVGLAAGAAVERCTWFNKTYRVNESEAKSSYNQYGKEVCSYNGLKHSLTVKERLANPTPSVAKYYQNLERNRYL